MLTDQRNVIRIFTMFQSYRNRRVVVIVSWLLAGCLSVSCLAEGAPSIEWTVVNSGHILLDVNVNDDDASDLRSLDFAFDIQPGNFLRSTDWGEIQIRYVSVPYQVRVAAHFVRGPPRV